MVVWGSTFIVSKELMAFLSPLQLMCLRFFIAYLTLWLLHPKWQFEWRTEIAFVVMAVFGNTLYFLAENTAITYTYTSNVSILVSSTTIMSLVLMWVLGKEKADRRQMLGFVMAFAGVVLVVLNGNFILKLSPAGDVLTLLAALSWALYGLFLCNYTKRFDSFLISRKVMLYGLLTSLPLALIEGKSLDLGSLFTVQSIAGLLFLAVVGSSLCYVIWNNTVKVLGVIRSNVYIYTVPVVTMIAGAICLGENITVVAVAGTALVIGGMLLSNRRPGMTED